MNNKNYIDGMLRTGIILASEAYLKRNPERFTEQEKITFRYKLNQFLDGRADVYDDNIFDFLVSTNFLKNTPTRAEEFTSYLNQKYKGFMFRKVLDVGAGRMCRLSVELSKLGGELFAIDPNIRISRDEAKKLGIKGFSKNKFVCDEYSKSGTGTDVSRYTNIVGLEPCDATEHIVRQGLKYDKPFDVLLCGSPHDSLDGKHFATYHDWFDYLASISAEVSINKVGGSYIATNEPQKGAEPEM